MNQNYNIKNDLLLLTDHLKMKLKIVKEKEPITNDWTVERVAQEYAPFTWESVFQNAQYEIKDVSDILEEDKMKNGRRLPDNKDLFKAFQMTPLHKVKVVIIGMDPYHTILSNGCPLATGIAFSIPKDVPVPSSLNNIFKELKNSIQEFNTPTHGDLTSWCLQGVFLLNACLTVRPSSPNCFKEIWNGFIKKIINAILEINPKCIFVAWGKNAQKVAQRFVGERSTVLTAPHPSGLSCYRGFIGCNHFAEINRLLVEQGKSPIDWNLF